MKNLYHMLNIDPNASAEQIAAALQLKPEMGVYAPILLDESRRSVYDRAHATLSVIGLLRHRLGLYSGDSWFQQNYPTYVPRLRQRQPQQEPEGAKSPEPGSERTHPGQQGRDPEAAPRHRRSWMVAALAGIIAVICLAAALTFF